MKPLDNIIVMLSVQVTAAAEKVTNNIAATNKNTEHRYWQTDAVYQRVNLWALGI